MLARDDMLDMEGEERIVVLVKATIFTASPCSAADQLARNCVDHEEVSRARALAWRMATTLAAMI